MTPEGPEREVRWDLVREGLGLCWSHAIWLSKRIGIPAPLSGPFVESVATGECLDVLVKCARTYDEGHPSGAKFTTYAFTSLRWSVKPCDVLPAVIEDSSDLRAPDPFLLVEGKDEAHNILRRLGEGDRTVLLLRYWKGLSFRRMAAELGCSRGTAMNRFNEALRNAAAVAKRRPR